MLSVSGCGLVAIPPALTIASYAADGISFLVTGKSVTDHAVSEVADADCAMWRMIKMQNPCLNEEGEAEMLIAFEGDPYDPPPLMNEPNLDWGPTQPGGPEEHLAPAPAGDALADASGAPGTAPADAADPAASVEAEPEDASDVLPAAGPEQEGTPAVLVQDLAPPATAEPGAEAAGRGAGPDDAGPGGQLMAAAGGEVDDATPVQVAALGPEPSAESPQAAATMGERRFLVIGSFAERGNAVRLAQANPRLAPQIAPAEVSGRQVYRVVTETAAAEDAEFMREWLLRNGFASAWPIAACADGAAGPNCLRSASVQF